jgi:hypothetical protein
MTEGTTNDWAENYMEQAMEQKWWGSFEQFEEAWPLVSQTKMSRKKP